MGNQDPLIRRLKELIKSDLQPVVSASWVKHSNELAELVRDATDSVARQVLDETRIEEIANSARQGASYIAISTLIDKVIQDAVSQGEPIAREMAFKFANIIMDALKEAISELIQERLQNYRKSEGE